MTKTPYSMHEDDRSRSCGPLIYGFNDYNDYNDYNHTYEAVIHNIGVK